MATFMLICSAGLARDIANELRDEGFYVEVKADGNNHTFEIDGAPQGDEPEEMTEVRVLRAVVSILSTYASDILRTPS
jgi:hypothetical protein